MGSATGTSTSHAKSTRWVPYGGEANRDAKNRKAQRAGADRPERNGQTEPFARVAKPEGIDGQCSLFFNKGKKQMDENQFWTNVWRTGAIAAVSIVAVIAGCIAYNTAAIKDMVANGANPIDAMCSINGTSTTPECMVRAVGK